MKTTKGGVLLFMGNRLVLNEAFTGSGTVKKVDSHHKTKINQILTEQTCCIVSIPSMEILARDV